MKLKIKFQILYITPFRQIELNRTIQEDNKSGVQTIQPYYHIYNIIIN